jgi:hypothetical protein
MPMEIEMKKNLHQIMKQNSLILAKYEQKLNSIDLRLVNILIHAQQNLLIIGTENINLFNYQQLKERKIMIKSKTIKEAGCFGVNANEDIFLSLKKIRDTSAIVKNFTDVDGKTYRAMIVALIDGVRMIDKKIGTIPDEREVQFEITFSEWFLKTSTAAFNTKVGNYAKMPAIISTISNNKSAIKLYELLKVYEYKNYFSIKLLDLQKHFEVEYTLAEFKKIIDRTKPKIETSISFEYEIEKKDKIINFYFIGK